MSSKSSGKPAKKDATIEEKNSKLIFFVLVIALVAAIYYLPSLSRKESGENKQPAKIQGSYIIHEDMPHESEKGKVKLLVFFDFYCPHCFNFDTQVLPELKKKYGEKLMVTSLGYPLAVRSVLPIQAHEAAKVLGKGEEFKALAFEKVHVEKKDISSVEAVKEIAKEAGINENEFLKALEGVQKGNKLSENIALASKYKIEGTPLIIINGNVQALNYFQENLEKIIGSLI